MGKSLDMFSGKNEDEKSEIFSLPNAPVQGKKSSPHTITLRKKNGESVVKEKSPEKTLSRKRILDFPEDIHGRLNKRSRVRGSSFFREIRRMITLGSIVLFSIWSLSFYAHVRSVEQNITLEKERIFQELETLKSEVRSGDILRIREQIELFQNTLSESLFLFQSLSLESPSDDMTPSILEAVELLLESGDIMAETVELVYSQKENAFSDISLILSGELDFITFLDTYLPVLDEVESYLTTVHLNLEKSLSVALPNSIQREIEEILPSVDFALLSIQRFKKHIPAVKRFFGKDHAHTILIALQNRDEIRPTGGFLGSFLLVHMVNGKILSWEYSDVYDSDGQLLESLPTPREYAHLAEKWYLRDANIFPNFPDSAKQIIWFLEHEKGPTVDTVIAVHQGVLEDLLSITGPIKHPSKTDLVLSQENASFLISYLVESKYFGTGGEISPKDFLSDFIPPLLDSFQKKMNYGSLLKLGETWILEKDIQVYSQDEAIQEIWDSFSVSGEYFPSDEKVDFLGVVHSNIGGNKSDAFIHEAITEKTMLNLSGEMIHHITVERSHLWSEHEEHEFENLFTFFGSELIQKDDLKTILGKGENRVYTSVYVPRGSMLLNTENLSQSSIFEENTERYTRFSFFAPVVQTGDTVLYSLVIKSPFHIDTEHGEILRFQALSQPGSQNRVFTKEILTEAGLTVDGTEIINKSLKREISGVYLIQKN